MKSQIDVYGKKKKIEEEKENLIKRLEANESALIDLQTNCSHQLALLFDDYIPHKVGRIIECFCPACGKKESIYPSIKIEKTCFKNSKLIDLTGYPTSFFDESYFLIIEHIFDNYDLFYSDQMPASEISKSIVNFVESKKVAGQAKSRIIPIEDLKHPVIDLEERAGVKVIPPHVLVKKKKK